jgi:hypothetical protein
MSQSALSFFAGHLAEEWCTYVRSSVLYCGDVQCFDGWYCSRLCLAGNTNQCLRHLKESIGEGEKLVKQHSDFLLATWLRSVVCTYEALFYAVEMWNALMAGTAASYA